MLVWLEAIFLFTSLDLGAGYADSRKTSALNLDFDGFEHAVFFIVATSPNWTFKWNSEHIETHDFNKLDFQARFGILFGWSFHGGSGDVWGRNFRVWKKKSTPSFASVFFHMSSGITKNNRKCMDHGRVFISQKNHASFHTSFDSSFHHLFHIGFHTSFHHGFHTGLPAPICGPVFGAQLWSENSPQTTPKTSWSLKSAVAFLEKVIEYTKQDSAFPSLGVNFEWISFEKNSFQK